MRSIAGPVVFWYNYIVRKILITFGLSALVLLGIFFLVRQCINKHDDRRGVGASDALETISSDAHWIVGESDNISIEAGTIKIADPSNVTEIDLQSIYDMDSDNVTINIEAGSLPLETAAYNPIDGDESTYFYGGVGTGIDWDIGWWQIHMQEEKSIVRFMERTDMVPPGGSNVGHIYLSSDGENFDGASNYDCVVSGNYNDCTVDPITGVYFRIDVAGWQLHEIRIFEGATATHTTSPTQIDGQEGDENKTLIEWISFEPTATVPANTSVSYEFRVSDDAENWTEWTSNFASLENRRYLQIKATLTSNDGVSTPQIDDYTINFHNNLPPNAPTAQTAVINN